jgi:hypothetical protein
MLHAPLLNKERGFYAICRPPLPNTPSRFFCAILRVDLKRGAKMLRPPPGSASSENIREIDVSLSNRVAGALEFRRALGSLPCIE